MATKKTKKTTRKKKGKAINLKDERIPKIVAIICLLFAIYLCIAFTSYFLTWKFDQDKVLQFSAYLLFQNDISVSNWLGRLGAIVSNAFFYWGFGLPSFGFVLILIRLAYDLIKKNPIIKTFDFAKHTILIISFCSIILEFFMYNSAFSWGGAFGESVNIWLTNLLGRIGLLLLLFFIMLSTFMWFVNPQIELNTPAFVQQLVPKFNFSNMWPSSEPISGPKVSNTLRPRHHSETQDMGHMPKTEPKDKGSLGSKLEFKLPNVFKKEKEKPLPPTAPIIIENSAPDGKTLNLQAQPDTPDNQTDLEISVPEKAANSEAPDLSQVSIVDPATVKPEEPLSIQEENKVEHVNFDPKLDLSKYKFPSLELLEKYEDQKFEVDRSELEANKDQIITTLLNYKIEITKIRATIGPTVTLYEIVPAAGVRISKIKNLEDDIALSLAALGIRIIAPIPGKGTIGIEVPNKKKQMVSFYEVIKSDKFINAKMDLPIALGKTISNEVFVADLAKMPHLLIAGATGQGKSVGINTIIMSILYKKHPSQVKIVMIDPKKVELFPYSALDQHFLAFLPNQDEPIVTETQKVIFTLNSLCIEMDERYDLLKKAKARNLKEYNQKFVQRKLNPQNGHKFLPFIVLVIDEFADLIMTAGKEVEMPIARLAQLARAIGIHLIIATQRPSVNIITGTIKANFPARIAFKVTSKIDSRTILDQGGADQLIGRGDMLLSVGSNTVRLQCAFVDTPEVERVIETISEQQGFPEPFYLPEFKGEEDISSDGSSLKASDLDDMFMDAAKLVVGAQSGSTSNIQRRLQLGYNRAGRIMDQLEALGIVGPPQGSKPREVYVYTEVELDQIMESIMGKK
jgi:S-DNA-T family DNA segregation ATPase FtsK/SpoIIIE